MQEAGNFYAILFGKIKVIQKFVCYDMRNYIRIQIIHGDSKYIKRLFRPTPTMWVNKKLTNIFCAKS